MRSSQTVCTCSMVGAKSDACCRQFGEVFATVISKLFESILLLLVILIFFVVHLLLFVNRASSIKVVHNFLGRSVIKRGKMLILTLYALLECRLCSQEIRSDIADFLKRAASARLLCGSRRGGT